MESADDALIRGLAVPAADTTRMLIDGEEFTVDNVTHVRHLVAHHVHAVSGGGVAAEDFVLAVNELMTNAVRHGGGAGTLRLAHDDETLTCEVTDCGGAGADLHVHTPSSTTPGGRGLWLAQQLSDALMLTQRADGVTATVSMCLPHPMPRGNTAVTLTVDCGEVTLTDQPDRGESDGSPHARA